MNCGGINDSGEIAVVGSLKTGTKKASWTPYATLRISTTGTVETVGPQGIAWDINNDGDILFYDSPSDDLAYNGSAELAKQSIKILDLIPDTDPNKSLLASGCSIRCMNDRNTTGFPQLAGFIAGSGPGFVLAPFIPQ